MIFYKNLLNIKNKINSKIYSKSVMGKELQELGNNICKNLSFELNTPFVFYFNAGIPSYNGISTNSLDHKNKCKIICGSSEMVLTRIDPQILTNSIITIFHEARHFEQLIDIKNATASENIVYSHLSHYDKGYYLKNYSLSYDELDADYSGIMQAYEYISVKYPEINVIEHIKTYMSIKRNFYEDLDINSIKTIDDIEKYFYKKEEELVFHVKTDDISDIDSPLRKYLLDLRQDFKIFDKEKGVTGDNIFKSVCKTNLDCDKFVSMVILEQFPEYKDNYPQIYQNWFKDLNIEYFIENINISETNKDFEQ